MHRSLAIISWILLGALASGVGMGWVLRSANHDRQTLAQALQEANNKNKSLEQNYQDTANASQITAQELGRLQSELDNLKSWHTILKKAPTLPPPAPARLKGWSEFASVPMGVAIRVPPGSQARTNDDGLFLRTQPKPGQTGIEEQWLVLVKYNESREKEFYKNSPAYNSSPVDYSLDNRLIGGMHGMASGDSNEYYVLRVEDNATSTYLIWTKTVPGIDGRTILDTLATLSFR